MARKTANVPIDAEGRDKGKLYVITEMPASQGEEWAMRAVIAIIGANPEIPEDFGEFGMAGLAQLGFRSLTSLRFEVLKPLLDEMMDCIQIAPDRSKMQVVRPIVETDIEEITTRLSLRVEWWKLHMDFLEAAANSVFAQQAAAKQSPGRATRTSRK